MNLGATIGCSIRAMFELYRCKPLRVLREIGMQAHLCSLLQGALQEDCAVQMLVGRKRVFSSTDRLERVQMELRVQNAVGSGVEKSDIVVLRRTEDESPISLTLAPNGHLDVISKVALADVDAVIEVKAACSADSQQRHRFRSDVEKLLLVGRQAADVTNRPVPELHFVLIDKSLKVGEHKNCKKPPQRDFANETNTANWTDRARDEYWERSPKITLSRNRPETGIFVHVWFMEHGERDNSTENVELLFATSTAVPILNPALFVDSDRKLTHPPRKYQSNLDPGVQPTLPIF